MVSLVILSVLTSLKINQKYQQLTAAVLSGRPLHVYALHTVYIVYKISTGISKQNYISSLIASTYGSV